MTKNWIDSLHLNNYQYEKSSFKKHSLKRKLLHNKYIKECFNKILVTYYQDCINNTLIKSLYVSEKNFPVIYKLYNDCCKKLNIENPPEVYITNDIRGINALSMKLNERNIIFLGRKTIVLLDNNELKFLLGHELGHHMQGNIEFYLVNGIMHNLNKKMSILGNLTLDVINIPLNKWCQESEYKADMAGYICCEDMNTIENIFNKILPLKEQRAIDEYMELSSDHPLIIKRINRLKEQIK